MRDGDILVLTTREMDYWLSFQEIVPALERVWARIGQSGREAVRMFRVPLAPEVERLLLTSSSRVKRIVMIARSAETIRMALHLRRRMNVAAPMIIYVHGDALEGFQAFGALPNFLTEMDVLVVTCEAEARTTRCCLPNAQVTVIPFPLVDGFKVNGEGGDPGHEAAGLAYVGRISEQKNLHTLLLALWVLRTSCGRAPKISLDVYGAEDNLGTPHSGLQHPAAYGTYLQRLAESLGVHDIVRWHGFKQRDWLFEHVHTQPHVLVSPTLHSDENFGSSLLASLANGHQALTTAWGGHLEFKEWFSEQLSLVPVHRSTRGPIVDPVLLANAILRAATRRSTAIVDEATLDRGRAAFSEGSVTTRTLELLSRPGGGPVPLERSPSLRYIDERRAYYGGADRIYSDADRHGRGGPGQRSLPGPPRSGARTRSRGPAGSRRGDRRPKPGPRRTGRGRPTPRRLRTPGRRGTPAATGRQTLRRPGAGPPRRRSARWPISSPTGQSPRPRPADRTYTRTPRWLHHMGYRSIVPNEYDRDRASPASTAPMNRPELAGGAEARVVT